MPGMEPLSERHCVVDLSTCDEVPGAVAVDAEALQVRTPRPECQGRELE